LRLENQRLQSMMEKLQDDKLSESITPKMELAKKGTRIGIN